MSNTPLTDAQIAAENELICTKLLGWYKCEHITHIPGLFHTPEGKHEQVPPFTTWADAGLILDALQKAGPLEVLSYSLAPQLELRLWPGPVSITCEDRGLTPVNIRRLALEYIRSLP